MRLESFLYGNTPPYAILSHTWGEGEVTFQDVTLPHPDLGTKRGWLKIVGFRDAIIAKSNLLKSPVQYVWVDTCCIDKTSSSELSEAINSMFRWYRESVICFALLEDVALPTKDDSSVRTVGDDFEQARWFTRGWTLQELLAPSQVEFFDQNWAWIGSKADLASRISLRTNIAEEVVLTGEWPFASISQRMAWAAGRVTTQMEDMAYCLLGIFDVHMPMLYGEGERAFVRLQEEIIKESDDHSIFAWDAADKPESVETIGIFATSPSYFKDGASIEPNLAGGEPFSLTNKGLNISVPIIERSGFPGEQVVILSCTHAGDVSSFVGIQVRCDPANPSIFSRLRASPVTVPLQNPAAILHSSRSVFLAKRDHKYQLDYRPLKYHIRGLDGYINNLEFVAASPRDSWTFSPAETMTLLVPLSRKPQDEAGFSAVLVFRHIPSSDAFCLIIHSDVTRSSQLSLIAAPSDLPEGEALELMMNKLRETAPLLDGSEYATLRLPKVTISAAGTLGRSLSSTTFQVVLGTSR